ncbi:MAG: hypothetical protein ACR2K5_04445 [Pseudolabrys sp.]
MAHIRMFRAAITVVAMLAAPAFAQNADLILEKKTFVLPSYTTAAGATIKNVKIGWEAAGTLNADKSNAILITHFFTATSHAFGKYAASDAAAGYWNYLIGRARRSTPTNIMCCRRIPWSISTPTRPTSSPPGPPASIPTPASRTA